MDLSKYMYFCVNGYIHCYLNSILIVSLQFICVLKHRKISFIYYIVLNFIKQN